MKTLGQVAYEARFQDAAENEWEQLWRKFKKEWEAVAAAVVAEYEARKWQGIATLPDEGEVIVGVKIKGSWHQQMGPVRHFKGSDTYTHWMPAPEGPR